MRLLIIQFGDYAEAEKRFARGGPETYYAQRYTVEYVAGLARAGNQVRVIGLSADAEIERLPSGVECQSVKLYPGRFRRPRIRALIALCEAFGPTHLLLGAPLPELLHWAVRHRIETLPLLADSFCSRGLKRRLGYFRLARALNLAGIRWVANHGPNAAADLVRIGVNARKVLPFDWPALVSPSGFAQKSPPADPATVQLVYAGMLIEAKGVGDLVQALALAKSTGRNYRATLIGSGDGRDALQNLSRRLGVEDRVEFTGRVAHPRVLELMNAGDVVVVPSRHEYPEGMPMTIYEGLCSRSPVVISDHPMFRGRIEHRQSGMIFRGGDAQSLFDTVRELVEDRELYARLSTGAESVCEHFFGRLKWDHLITRWLAGTPDDDAWLRQYALTG